MSKCFWLMVKQGFTKGPVTNCCTTVVRRLYDSNRAMVYDVVRFSKTGPRRLRVVPASYDGFKTTFCRTITCFEILSCDHRTTRYDIPTILLRQTIIICIGVEWHGFVFVIAI